MLRVLQIGAQACKLVFGPDLRRIGPACENFFEGFSGAGQKRIFICGLMGGGEGVIVQAPDFRAILIGRKNKMPEFSRKCLTQGIAQAQTTSAPSARSEEARQRTYIKSKGL